MDIRASSAPLAGVTDLLLAAGQDDAGLTFVEGAADYRTLSYAELAKEALAALASLQAVGLQSGDPVILQTDDNQTTLTLLWACLFGGMLPVPLHVGGAPEHLRKVLNVWRSLGRPWIAADTQRLAVLQRHWGEAREDVSQLAKRTWCADAPPEATAPARPAAGSGDAVAMLQFSSGSTGRPKGVMLSHRNIITNTRAIARRAGLAPADRMLSWVPLSHDLGMIGVHFTAALHGIPCAIMPTKLFVRHPGLWMDTADALRSTVLYSTNYALDFFVASMERSPRSVAWDLSSVHHVFLGAEPIAPRSCRRFVDLLAPHGLRRHCLVPSYGLAEGTLAVAVPDPGKPLKEIWVDPARLSPGHPIVEAAPNGPTVALVACGRPVEGCEVRIEDENGAPLPDRHLGRIAIAGPSVACGYWGMAQPVRRDGWLDTGDFGAFVDGALVVAGRAKEIIILDGLNVYPYDVERIIVEALALDPGTVVVCGVRPDPAGPEGIAVFLRFKGSDDAMQTMAARVRAAVRDQSGLPVAAVVRVRNLPRTTSGKPRRHALARAFERGELVDVKVPSAVEASRLDRLLACATNLCGPLDADRSLRDQGVSSLIMAELAMRLGRELGFAVPLTRIMAVDRLRDLADALNVAADERSPVPGMVWLVRERTNRPPLFLIHPGSGAVTPYLPLARRLAAAMPVAGLQAPGVEAGERVLLSVEALAEHHVKALRAAWPDGPYHVGGWSFGGAVAMEAARRLRDAGHAVAPVILFDAFLPGSRVRGGGIPSDPDRVDEAVVAGLLGRCLEVGDRVHKPLNEMLAEARERNLLQSILGAAMDGPSAVRLIRCYSAALAAGRRYRPAPYEGEVVLIRGRAGPPLRDPTLGWGRLAPNGLTLLWTDGDHETMVDDVNADSLATAVGKALRR